MPAHFAMLVQGPSAVPAGRDAGEPPEPGTGDGGTGLAGRVAEESGVPGGRHQAEDRAGRAPAGRDAAVEGRR